jgi:hypothetical protein
VFFHVTPFRQPTRDLAEKSQSKLCRIICLIYHVGVTTSFDFVDFITLDSFIKSFIDRVEESANFLEADKKLVLNVESND